MSHACERVQPSLHVGLYVGQVPNGDDQDLAPPQQCQKQQKFVFTLWLRVM